MKLRILMAILSLTLHTESIATSDCISNAKSTFHLMECYRELGDQEDVKLQARLDKVYQEHPKLAPKIKQSYQHWLTYRESHCSLVYDAWGDGSARQYAYGKCLYKMARDWDNPMYINYK